MRDSLKEKQDFLQLEKPNYIKTLNEIIDNAILANIKTLTEEQLKEFEKDVRSLYLQIYLKRTGLLNIEIVDGIETLSLAQLLSASLQEIGAEFVKKVNGYKQIDKLGKTEIKKLMDFLVAEKLIEVKKKEEVKSEGLIKKAQEKIEEKANAAAAKSVDKPKAAAKAKAAAKKKDAKAATKKAGGSKSAADAKKKAEEEKKKKLALLALEEERRKAEARRRAKKKRKGYFYGSSSFGGEIARNPGEAVSRNADGKIVFSSSSLVGVRAGNRIAGVGVSVSAKAKTARVSTETTSSLGL